MNDNSSHDIGRIEWQDLTVTNASEIKDFYQQVIGWQVVDHNMGAYNDFEMQIPETKETVAGICFARGENSNLPPQWLIYVAVEDVEHSIKECKKLGGHIIDGPRDMGGRKFCCICDPSGAVLGLIERVTL